MKADIKAQVPSISSVKPNISGDLLQALSIKKEKEKTESAATVAPPLRKESVASVARPLRIDPEEQLQRLRTALDRELAEMKKEATKTESSEHKVKKDLEDSVLDRAGELLGKRNKKKKAQMDLAKKILIEAGLDFNRHFQKLHRMKLDKGHWSSFLDAVVAASEGDVGQVPEHLEGELQDLQCKVCKDMFDHFDILGARDRLLRAKAKAKAKKEKEPDDLEQALEECAEQYERDLDAEAAENPEVPEEPPAKKRRGAGRPRKGQELEFKLLDFLDEERFEVYHFLTEDEASGFYFILFIYIYL